MALLSVIRRWHFREHLSIRAIARRTGLSRNTIRKYLRSETVALFRTAAAGAGVIPWTHEHGAAAERWFHMLLTPPPPASRTISLEGARILAGQLRDAVEARDQLVAERAPQSRACPLDLHRLLPVPDRLLRLGPDHRDSRAWLWSQWGTTEALRGVVELPIGGRSGARRRDPGFCWAGFWSDDWTPWPALLALRARWPGLRLGAYEGPLDLLLELARAQRVDLAAISVVALAEAFGAAVERAIAGRLVPLSQIADWLVMAAWLLLLRSRLLLPAGSEADRAAQAEAAELRRRLADREAVRTMASWLERRPQLGREVFGQGALQAEPQPVSLADITELLRACLRLIALPMRHRVYRPNPPSLWRVPDALARIRDLLAALELGRDGVLTLEQEGAFGEIGVRRTGSQPTFQIPGAGQEAPSGYSSSPQDAEAA